MAFDFSSSPSDWQAPISDQHPFIAHIQAAVLRYRLSSAAHFSVPIEVSQQRHKNNPKCTAKVDEKFYLIVGFYNFGASPVYLKCRPKPGTKQEDAVSAENLQVKWQFRDTPLDKFLGAKFPPPDLPVGTSDMFEWWGANGKTFDWNSLPTELRIEILAHCKSEYRSSWRPRRYQKQVSKGAPEVRGQFGPWVALLSVSKNVRELSLGTCFGPKARLHLEFRNLDETSRTVQRLDKHKLMSEADSIPIDTRTKKLAHLYTMQPKRYPHLSRYSTFLQGVSSVRVQLSFWDAMRFYKVEAGGLSRYWVRSGPDYTVFERLPTLKRVSVHLPDAEGRLEDDVRQPVRLFHGTNEDYKDCPRVLHRLIYEKVVEELGHYEGLEVLGFIDKEEEERFEVLRGGRQIQTLDTKPEQVGSDRTDAEGHHWGVEKNTLGAIKQQLMPAVSFPPKCTCSTPCREAIHGKAV